MEYMSATESIIRLFADVASQYMYIVEHPNTAAAYLLSDISKLSVWVEII